MLKKELTLKPKPSAKREADHKKNAEAEARRIEETEKQHQLIIAHDKAAREKAEEANRAAAEREEKDAANAKAARDAHTAKAAAESNDKAKTAQEPQKSLLTRLATSLKSFFQRILTAIAGLATAAVAFFSACFSTQEKDATESAPEAKEEPALKSGSSLSSAKTFGGEPGPVVVIEVSSAPVPSVQIKPEEAAEPVAPEYQSDLGKVEFNYKS